MKNQTTRWQKADGPELGHGGNAHVYRVSDTTQVHPLDCALKELTNLKAYPRFRREVDNLRKVQGQPNIVPLLDAYLPDEPTKKDRPYIVMPLAADTLAGRVEAGRYVGRPVDALPVFEALCRGIQSLHATGLSHRDLKPGNVLFGPDGTLWLADLGLALDVETPEAERLTSTKEQIGSRFYLAPELRDGRNPDADHRPSDLYGLGKILYVMLAGEQFLFDRESHGMPDYNLINIHDDPRYAVVNAFLDRLLTVNPAHRASIDSVLRDLPALMKTFETNATSRPVTDLNLIEQIATQLERDTDLAARREAGATRASQVAYVVELAQHLYKPLFNNSTVQTLWQRISRDFTISCGDNSSLASLNNPSAVEFLSGLGYDNAWQRVPDHPTPGVALCIEPRAHVLEKYPLIRVGFLVAPLPNRPRVYALVWKSWLSNNHWADGHNPVLAAETFWVMSDEYGSISLRAAVQHKAEELVAIAIRELGREIAINR